MGTFIKSSLASLLINKRRRKETDMRRSTPLSSTAVSSSWSGDVGELGKFVLRRVGDEDRESLETYFGKTLESLQRLVRDGINIEGRSYMVDLRIVCDMKCLITVRDDAFCTN